MLWMHILSLLSPSINALPWPPEGDFFNFSNTRRSILSGNEWKWKTLKAKLNGNCRRVYGSVGFQGIDYVHFIIYFFNCNFSFAIKKESERKKNFWQFNMIKFLSSSFRFALRWMQLTFIARRLWVTVWEQMQVASLK